MRIISGALKGKSINFLRDSITRPLKDNVRENIFNILKHSNLIPVKIENANILDLYSGIGSFGLECISRGAKKVTFIEENKNTFKILKENLIKLEIVNKAILLNDKIEDVLKYCKNEKFNIFFLDPPFNNNDFIKNIDLIKKLQIINKRHIVIIHREQKTLENLEKFLDITFVKQYGRSKIIFGLFN